MTFEEKIEASAAHTNIANTISEVLFKALSESELEPDQVLSLAANILADYGRMILGNEFLPHLAALVIKRAEMPLPKAEQ